MKLTMIRLVGASSVDLPIVGATPSGPFVLKSVDGLGPPEVDVTIADTVQEGGVYQGRRPQKRQIVARVGLQPDWNTGQTPEELRTILYGLLTPKYGNLVRAEIVNSGIVLAKGEGHISRFEVAMFSKDPEVQITLNCTHAYLMDPAIRYQIPDKTVSGTNTLLEVDNVGTAPSGFWMGITFTAPHVTTLQIGDDNPSGNQMYITGSWATGDTLTIDTRPGRRGIWKTPANVFIPAFSILDNLTANSEWLELYGGTNILRINNKAFNWYQQGFGHTPAYWGV